MSPKTKDRNRRLAELCAEVLADEPLCQLRLSRCTGQAETCHHRSARSTRPDLVVVRANLLASCSACNMQLEELTGEELEAAKRAGLKLAAWEDPHERGVERVRGSRLRLPRGDGGG